jgi:hypothetical protein
MAPWIAKQMVPKFSGVFSVKAGKALVNHFNRMLYLLRGGLTIGYIKVFVVYARFLSHLYRTTNMKYVVKYLKTAQICLMQSVAKQPTKNPSQVFGAAISCTGTGIPRVIPKAHRAHIRNGSTIHVRLWLTLFGLYRVLDYAGYPTIKTIVSPGVDITNSLFGELLVVIPEFISHHRLSFKPSVFKAWSILSTSPTSPHVINGGRKEGKYPSGHLYTVLNTLVAFRFAHSGWLLAWDFVKHGAILANMVQAPGLARLLSTLGSLTDLLDRLSLKVLLAGQPYSRLGKLAFKQEPAGKLRVFAMLDPISQWILKPIHDGIFGMLSQIVFDATFDQRGAVGRFNDTISYLKIKNVYSFDLTAATDRLPISIQTLLISYFIGEKEAVAWNSFLTERWFTLPIISGEERLTSCKSLGVSTPSPYLQSELTKQSHRNVFEDPSKVRSSFESVTAVRYAVGQPMGAYSSFALLALMHHLIVYMAWRRSGYNGKLLYLVLGDDIVIANSSIAEHYLNILTEIGAPVNLTKSIVSTNGSFEFAKRFIVAGSDVSPLSWKEMFVARWDINSLMSLAEENSVKLSNILSYLDHGYKAISRLTAPLNEMSRSMALTLLWFSRPGTYLSKMDSTAKWLHATSFNVYHEPDLDAKALVKWSQQLAMSMLRALKSPSHPLDPYGLRAQIIKFISEHCDGIHTPINKVETAMINQLTTMLWTSIYSFYREAMVYDYNAARGAIQRSIMEMKQALKSPYKAIDALDRVLQTVYESEKEASSFDQTNLSEWVNVEKVTTLNRCKELKWAQYLRKFHSNLEIVKPQRALKKGFTGKI